jgi:hypothetical protein
MQYWLQALGFVKRPKIEATDALVERILAAATSDPVRIEALEFDSGPLHTVPATAEPPATEHAAATGVPDGAANGNVGADSIMAEPMEGEGGEAAAPEDAEAAANAAAEAALRNIAAGLHAADGAKKASMVKVVETRNFAGKEIVLTTEHQAGSKAAENAQNRASAAASKSGLDAALANITGVHSFFVITQPTG